MAAVAESLDIVKLRSLRREFGTFVPRGHVLYSAGEAPDALYVVMSGRVQVERPSTGDEAIEPGGLVGEVDLFADEPRAGSATALSDCSLLAFDRESVSRLAEVTPTFALLAIRSACQRVVRLEHMLAEERSPASNSPGSATEVASGLGEPVVALLPVDRPEDRAESRAAEPAPRPTEVQRGSSQESTAPAPQARPDVTAPTAGRATGQSASGHVTAPETGATGSTVSERSNQPLRTSAASAAGTGGGATSAVSALVRGAAADMAHTPGVESGVPASSQGSAVGAPSTEPSPTAGGTRAEPGDVVPLQTVGPVLDVDHLNALSHKEARCPNCHSLFQAWSVRPEAATVVSRDKDFMNHYQGVDATWYAVWVCPSCQLAAYAEDFLTIQPTQLARVRPRLEYIRHSDARAYDFSHYRNADLALRSFQLAVARYADEDAAADRIAGLFHRMAWIERVRGNQAEERHWLETARQYYERAFRVQDSSQMGLVWSYLIAELDVRLGDYVNALRWFDTASRLPHFRQQSTLDKMLRDRQQEIAQMIRSGGARQEPSPRS